jgi:hypothetical protein
VLPFPTPIGPIVASLAAGTDRSPATIVITPGAPGRNQLQVFDRGGEPTVQLGGRNVPLLGGDGGWSATIDLDVGTTMLSVGGTALPLAVRQRPNASIHLTELVDPSSVNAAECASRVLGQLAAVRAHDEVAPSTAVLDIRSGGAPPARSIELPGCPRDNGAIEPRAAADATDDSGVVARTVATYLAQRGIRHLTVVESDDQRSQAFVRALATGPIPTTTAAPDLLPSDLGDAVVVATNWADTGATLDLVRAAPSSATRLVVLAPWLLRASLLAGPVSDPAAGQLTVAATVDPTSPVADLYVRDLARFAPRAEPSAPGLAGYVEALTALAGDIPAAVYATRAPLHGARVARPVPVTVQLLTSSAVAVLPAQLDAGHNHQVDSWLPRGGAIVPVSPVLTDAAGDS